MTLSWPLRPQTRSLLLLRPTSLVQAALGSGSVSAPVQERAGAKEGLRTVKDLPKVGFLKLVYRLLVHGYYNRMHELQLYEKALYGGIFRDGLGTVAVNRAELLEEVLRRDDRFPVRGDMSLWKEYRDTKGIGYGPFTEEGERWYRLRSALNRRMLLPKESVLYGPVIRDVVRDFTHRVQVLRESSPTGDMVQDVANELYRFSLEGIASILFETRIGCLEQQIPEGTQEFINSIVQMFSNSPYVIVMPKWSRPLLPYWRRYNAGWEGIFTFAQRLIDRKLEQIERRVDDREQVQGEYLTYLLSNTDMSLQDVYGSVAELLLAGVDTTSNTLTWALHLLSLNPEAQDRLHREVSQIQPDPPAEEITRLPYLKATIKETLRMYPVVPLNARVFSEKDVVIAGYHFPKKKVPPPVNGHVPLKRKAPADLAQEDLEIKRGMLELLRSQSRRADERMERLVSSVETLVNVITQSHAQLLAQTQCTCSVRPPQAAESHSSTASSQSEPADTFTLEVKKEPENTELQ
uniref:Cytochrome P450, family 27, subfamily A, polypeptide 7 n=1 Tax=Neogobius melanostomus TaxID=47308 RepID=A0A8C6WM66_9GOBI